MTSAFILRSKTRQRTLNRRSRIAPWAIAGAMALLLLTPALPGQEWTRFRGPNGEGVSETTFPTQITDRDVAWKTPLPGVGHSSPVAWGDRVFVLSADPDNATRHVLCLSLAGGQILWRRDYPSQPHHLHERSSYASSTPATDARHVYVAWSTPAEITFIALDHEGKDVWRRNLGPWANEHGYGASPIVHENLVILHNSQQAVELRPGDEPGQSTMLAMDGRTGATVWSTPLETLRTNYSVPCLYAGANGDPTLVCCSTSEGIFGIDLASGKLLWSTPDSFSMRTVSSPVVAGGLIFGSAGSGAGGNHVTAIRPGKRNEERPQLAYSVKRQAPYVPTMVAKGDLIFWWYDKGIVTCADAATGNEHWRERVDGGFSGSPMIAGDAVYCMSEEGDLVALAASKSFRALGQSSLGAPSRSTPAVAGGLMLLRTYTHLIAVRGTSAS